MLPILEKRYQTILILYLQMSMVIGATYPAIFQAQPQVMMHTLQQPIPIDTLQSLKAQRIKQELKNHFQTQTPIWMPMMQQTPSEILQRLAAIQSMQVPPMTNQLQIQSPILTPILLNQMLTDEMRPISPQLYQENQPIVSYQNQAEEAMQEIALQQQMLALQQLQALKQINNANSPFELYQPQPLLILLPDENSDDEQNQNLIKNSHYDDIGELNDGDNSVTIEGLHGQKPQHQNPNREIGMRKAILLVPNARFSIGGIISQIPWLPIEINVPDTAIWAWNGIYDGISSIISGIGNTWPFNLRPQRNLTTIAATSQPSVKMFLKQLQKNNALPVHAMP